MLAILIFGVFGTRAANAQQPEDQPPVDQQAPPDGSSNLRQAHRSLAYRPKPKRPRPIATRAPAA